MMRPRLLDLFCGAGGAAVGYHRAGFDVADIAPAAMGIDWMTNAETVAGHPAAVHRTHRHPTSRGNRSRGMSELTNAAKKARDWTVKRDALIRERHAAGVSLRAIGEEAGLSHSAIAKIVERVREQKENT